MKILVVVDDYLPHSSKVGAKMMHDLCRTLVKHGNELTVITPLSSLKKSYQYKTIEGVNVLYFKSMRIKNVNYVRRLLGEFLLGFQLIAAVSNNRNLFEDIDRLIYYSPSIFWGLGVKWIKTKFQCSTYLILRDFFPQWVVDNKMISKYNPLYFFFRYFENLTYKQADVIGIQSPNNIKYFKEIRPRFKNVELLYNWSSSDMKDIKPKGIRERYNLHGKVIFFYGGNLGSAQDMENLLRLAKRLQGYKSAHFLFIGDGDEKYKIKNRILNGQKNITLMDSVDQTEFKKILTEIDIGLFSLDRRHRSHNFPGKILGYLDAQKPILGSVNRGNDIIEVIHEGECGLIAVNGNDDDFYSNALKLLENENDRRQMGINGIKLLNSTFSTAKACEIVLKELV